MGTELLIQACVGFVAGLLGGLLGIGGSVIIIPALIAYRSYGGTYSGSVQHLLQASAMICNVVIAAPSALAHWLAKAIMVPVVVVLIPAATVGVLLGVSMSNAPVFAGENGAYLTILLACFLLYVAIYNTWSFYRRSGSQPPAEQRDRPHSKWKIAIVGLPMGFTAGLLGVGGGILAVPMQQLLLKIPLRNAIANSAATIVFTALPGAIYKNATLSLHGESILASLQLAAALVPTAMLGGFLGGRLMHLLPRRVLLWVFIIFMALMSLRTFTKGWSEMQRARLEGNLPASTPQVMEPQPKSP